MLKKLFGGKDKDSENIDNFINNAIAHAEARQRQIKRYGPESEQNGIFAVSNLEKMFGGMRYGFIMSYEDKEQLNISTCNLLDDYGVKVEIVGTSALVKTAEADRYYLWAISSSSVESDEIEKIRDEVLGSGRIIQSDEYNELVANMYGEYGPEWKNETCWSFLESEELAGERGGVRVNNDQYYNVYFSEDYGNKWGHQKDFIDYAIEYLNESEQETDVFIQNVIFSDTYIREREESARGIVLPKNPQRIKMEKEREELRMRFKGYASGATIIRSISESPDRMESAIRDIHERIINEAGDMSRKGILEKFELRIAAQPTLVMEMSVPLLTPNRFSAYIKGEY